MALDHPGAVSHLVFLGGVPIGEALARTDAVFAQRWDEDYRAAIHDPATVHAMVEDYRAGLGVDRTADDADKAAGRRV